MIDKSWRQGRVIENLTGGCVMCSADEIEKVMEEMLEKQEKKLVMALSKLNFMIDLNIKEFRDSYCSPMEEV